MIDIILSLLIFGVVLAGIYLLCNLLTGYLIRVAADHNMLDVPNARSSHTVPVPKTGGIAVIFGILLSILLTRSLHAFFPFPGETLLYLAAAICMIGITGILDDRYNLPIYLRAFIYLGVCAIFLLAVNYSATTTLTLPLLLLIPAALVMAWLVNLYNFMDGADGIAAVQALFASSVLLLATWWGADLSWQYHDPVFMLCLGSIVSVAAFLRWNLPPARVFLGDSGSCSLGFFFAALLLLCADTASRWLLLTALSPFVTDATLTLCKRFLNKEVWYKPHRSHAFQLWLQAGHTHKQLLSHFMWVLFVFVLPLCLLSWQFPSSAMWYCAGSYLGLGLLWQWIQINYGQTATPIEKP